MWFICDYADAFFGCLIVFIYVFVYGSLVLCAGCSCVEWGLSLVAMHRLLIAVASLLLWSMGSRACGAWALGHVKHGHAPWHVGSSPTRGQTPISCAGRQISVFTGPPGKSIHF